MATNTNLVGQASTLTPLPGILQRGLTAVSFFGFLSFVSSVALFLRLAYRLVTWKAKTHARVNQFVILIFNLILADIQQSLAFLLNTQWLRSNSIEVYTPTCWAQGWFVSTGDLASGVFTFAIALHAFFDIVHDFRLNHVTFLISIGGLWIFVYASAIIGIALHPSDFYVRAGAWCWINSKYTNERLWLHYFWVIIAEFGTVIVYTLIVLILRRRIKKSFYTTSATQLRARSAAKLIFAYPIVYIVCTLPLVIARLSTMAGRNVTFLELCVAGSMITSNGWVDVILYTVTRPALLSTTDSSPLDDRTKILDTFRLRPDQQYGVTTTIEARPRDHHIRKGSRGRGLEDGRSKGIHSRDGSQEELVGLQGVKSTTIVQTVVEPLEMMPGRSFDLGSAKSREK
ncbi:hypothetical protein LTR62_000725 [Meristemomyces frigidus]|uniref:G-protein coupled receptors family 1 profile domain-containing protein n=1 Tax=Meristemomyces frigidus TaxID=1508187 RepID=A0AAN7YC78_9PEZI|nr:hypothetical protein LTR62_000725 [Meristemomyces frigidus]